MPLRRLTIAALLLAACGGPTDDSAGTLPDDTGTPARDTGPGFVPVDTGDAALDDVPEAILTLREWGTAQLSPAGGPYTSLSGELRVAEYPDGELPDFDTEADTDLDSDSEEPLACELVYHLAGVPSEATCAGCAHVFDVQFTLLTGDRSGCHDPSLPEHASSWTLAWHPARSLWLRDVGNSGTWLPWFPAEQQGDELSFLWTTTVGVAVDEEM